MAGRLASCCASRVVLRVVLLALLGICRSGPRPGCPLVSAGAAEAAARDRVRAFVRSPAGVPWDVVLRRRHMPPIRTCVQCLRGTANDGDRRALADAGSEGVSDAPVAARWKVKRAAAGRGGEREQERSGTRVEPLTDPSGVEEVMAPAVAAVRSETRAAGPGRRRGGGRAGGPDVIPQLATMANNKTDKLLILRHNEGTAQCAHCKNHRPCARRKKARKALQEPVPVCAQNKKARKIATACVRSCSSAHRPPNVRETGRAL